MDRLKQPTVVLTGGGTGGHVYPALAVVERLRSVPRDSLVWIGSRGGVERAICRRAALAFVAIPSGKLRRYRSWRNVWDLFRVAAGILAALRLLRRLRPRVVFSKGGFVSVPVVLAAAARGVPVISHDSDVDPGLATRINARFSRWVCLPYERSARAVAATLRRRVKITGNPVRRAFLAPAPTDRASLQALGVPAEGPVLFVTGGSLGAHQINALVEAQLDLLTRHAFVVHQSGASEAILTRRLAERYPGRYVGRATYGREFAPLLRRAELTVARAGAGTLWELAACGTPALLIPLSAAHSRGDQLRNAELFRAAGAAAVLRPDTLTSLRFAETVVALLGDTAALGAMRTAMRSLAPTDAAATLAALVDGVFAS